MWASSRPSHSSTGIGSASTTARTLRTPRLRKPAAAITGVCHHVALLRTPELVVDYLEGPPPPEGGTEWAGVFRAQRRPGSLTSQRRSHRHTTRGTRSCSPRAPGGRSSTSDSARSRSALENRWAPRKKPAHADVASTALVADELAHLVGAVDGRGKGRRRKEPVPSKPGAARPKIDFTYLRADRAGRGVGRHSPVCTSVRRPVSKGPPSGSASQRRSTGPRPTRTLIRTSPSSRCVSQGALRRGREAGPVTLTLDNTGPLRWSSSPDAAPRRPSCSTWKPSPSGEAPHRPVPHAATGRRQPRGMAAQVHQRRRAAAEGSAALGLPDRP